MLTARRDPLPGPGARYTWGEPRQRQWDDDQHEERFQERSGLHELGQIRRRAAAGGRDTAPPRQLGNTHHHHPATLNLRLDSKVRPAVTVAPEGGVAPAAGPVSATNQPGLIAALLSGGPWCASVGVGWAKPEGGQPPVPAAEQAHEGGDEDEADEDGVDGDGDGKGQSELFEFEDVGGEEACEDGDHDRGGRGDGACGVGEPGRDGALVVAAGVPVFADATNQEHHARPRTVAVFPTPPFWLATAILRGCIRIPFVN